MLISGWVSPQEVGQALVDNKVITQKELDSILEIGADRRVNFTHMSRAHRREFIKKNGEFTVNIALVEDGNPILGVIYVPANDVLYTGIVDGQTTPQTSAKGEACKMESGNIQSLPLGERLDSTFCIVASRSHLSAETETFIEEMRQEHEDIRLVSSGSSLKICLVAEGSADVYPRFAPTMEWDTAAGDAIARAAGREMVNAETGEPLTYNKPDLHNPWFIVR
jgi:3'(2'), 5'-bisphosphate nucleotidase